MEDDVHFSGRNPLLRLMLIPLGEGFLEKEQMGFIQEDLSIMRLNTTISSFHNSIVSGSRRSRAEKPFISKAKYILGVKKSFATKKTAVEEVASLLADCTTLFSVDYQRYMTDHPFFLEYRRECGNSMEKERQFCRNAALKGVDVKQKKYYEEALIWFQEKMDKEKWSAKYAEEKFASDLINREISLKELCEFLSCCIKDNMGLGALALKEIQSSYPEIDLKLGEVEKLVRDYWCLSSDGKLYLNSYKRFLAYYYLPIINEDEYASMAHNTLKRWLPGIKMERSESGPFVAKVLKTYLFYCNDIRIVKENSGHYRRSFRVYDKEACEQYLDRKAFLLDVMKRYTAWHPEVIGSFANIAEVGFGYWNSKEYAKGTEQVVGLICERTKQYFENTRSGAKNFNDSRTRSIIKDLYLAEDGSRLFPFRYMMICIAGTSRFFSSERTMQRETIAATIKNPYRKKPSKAKQRISRIRFLNDLNKISGLDRAVRSNNWKLFLQVHGSVIESPEEADLWREIVYGGTICKENLQEDIPPIELALLSDTLLRDCLPIQEQFLYCYQGGTYIQEGGYAKFLVEFSDVLEECVKRLRRSTKKRNSPEKEYLKLWSGISCDVKQVKDLCMRTSSCIHWETIQGASRQALSSFLLKASCCGGSAVEDSKIDEEIENLRNLLIETSFRKILATDATKVLRKNAEKVFNKNSKFGISLSKI